MSKVSRDNLFADLKRRDALYDRERELEVAADEAQASVDWDASDTSDPNFKAYEAKQRELAMVRKDIASAEQRITFAKAALPMGHALTPEGEFVNRAVKDFFNGSGAVANLDSETKGVFAKGNDGISLNFEQIEAYLQAFYGPHFSNAGLQSDNDTGKETVQTDVNRFPILRQKYFQGILSVCNMFYYTGGPLKLPKWDVTGRTANEHDEGAAINAVAPPNFTEDTVDGFPIEDATAVTERFMRRSQLANVELLLAEMLLQSWARKLAEEMVSSPGTVASGERTDMMGLDRIAPLSTATSKRDGTAFDFDDLIDVRQEIDPSYRMGGGMNGPTFPSYTSVEMLLGEGVIFGQRDMGPCWMFNSKTEGDLAKFKVGSTDNRPLWLEAFAMGLPVSILGYPYKIIQQMASFDTGLAVGANQRAVVVFGDTSHILTRIGAPITVRRDDDSYTRLGGGSGLPSGSIAFSIQSEADQIFGASNGAATPRCDALVSLQLTA